MHTDSDFLPTGLEEFAVSRHANERITAEEVFIVPHVKTVVLVPNQPVFLYRDGMPETRFPEIGEALRQRLASRDWRNLLGRLVKLDLTDRDQVACWLNDAGYLPLLARLTRAEDSLAGATSVPRVPYPAEVFEQEPTTVVNAIRPDEARKSRPARAVEALHFEGSAWEANDVLQSLVEWLRQQRDVLAWLLSLDQKRFRKAVAAAWQFSEHTRNVFSARLDAVFEDRKMQIRRNPARDLLEALAVPKNIDLKTLADSLIGAGPAPLLHAWFHWDRTGRPCVTVSADTPMQALVLLVHLDKNFVRRKWVKCANCGDLFEQERRTQKFCSGSCKNTGISRRWRSTQSRPRKKNAKARGKR